MILNLKIWLLPRIVTKKSMTSEGMNIRRKPNKLAIFRSLTTTKKRIKASKKVRTIIVDLLCQSLIYHCKWRKLRPGSISESTLRPSKRFLFCCLPQMKRYRHMSWAWRPFPKSNKKLATSTWTAVCTRSNKIWPQACITISNRKED